MSYTMTFREALRDWANRPTRKEIADLERIKRSRLDEQSKESAIIRNQRKQIEVLEELLEKSYTQIKQQSDVIASHKEGDWMDKLIDKGLDIADNFMAPKPQTINITPKTANTHTQGEATQESLKEIPLENASPYTNEEILKIVEGFSQEDLIKTAKAPYGFFSNAIKKNYPRASNENVLEAFNIVQEKAEDGKK